jgi:hypothetical protein
MWNKIASCSTSSVIVSGEAQLPKRGARLTAALIRHDGQFEHRHPRESESTGIGFKLASL